MTTKKAKKRKIRQRPPSVNRSGSKVSHNDVLGMVEKLGIRKGEMTAEQRVKFWGTYMKIARRVKWYTLRGIQHRAKAAWELFKALQERDNG